MRREIIFRICLRICGLMMAGALCVASHRLAAQESAGANKEPSDSTAEAPSPSSAQTPVPSTQSTPSTPSTPSTQARLPPIVRSTAVSDVPQTPLGEAMVLEHAGDCKAAVAKYQEVLQERPKSPDSYAGITRCYLKEKDLAKAYETVTKGVQVADGWPVEVALGEVYFRQGKISEAEQKWIEVIKAGHPNAARAYLGLARVRWAIAMYKSAKQMIDRAHEIDPNDRDIERFWISNLPFKERVKYYESYLNDKSLDEDKREATESYLKYLMERAKQHARPCRLVSKVTNTSTPLIPLLTDPTHLRGYGLRVNLNGTRTNVLLDTGASGIMVKRSIAERAGITKLSESKISGIGDKGQQNGYVGLAKSIRIGELEFQDCPVRVLETGSLVGEDGLVGTDVFENFLVEINFPDEKLKLSELPKRPGEAEEHLALKNDDDADDESSNRDDSSEADAKKTVAKAVSGPQDRYIAPEMQSYTHVYRFGHDLLVPTKVGEVPGMLFLLDTGAFINAISPGAAREVTKVHGDAYTTIKGLSGSVKKVYTANKAVLQFGHLRQENQDMTAFDMSRISESSDTEVSGFFGFTMLRYLDIKIDYRDALVDFTYDAKRFGR